jgi:hypothetical protein
VHRGDVDDPPAPARCLAQADELLAAEEGAVKIGADDPVPVLERHLGERLSAAAHPGIVDQDVGRPELIAGATKQIRDGGGVSHVGLDHNPPPTNLRHPAQRRLRACLVLEVVDDEVRVLLRELDCGGLADAGVRPGDHGRPVVEAHGCPSCG